MNQPRDQWTSRAGFVLAAAGSAIGLGNLWKFPYITWENEGGAFVLVYLVCIALVGLPIMMAELLIGRRTQKSPVGALKEAVGPAWGWVGKLGVLTGFIVLGYYTVIAGWSLRSFINCVNWSVNGYPGGETVGNDFTSFLANSSQQILTTILFMGFTMAVIYRGVGKGIEKISRLLMPILMGILLVLLASALSMEGAGKALSFIFAPNFSTLTGRSLLEALGHSFFTLSLGMGTMITYGSYMSKQESVVRSALVVVVLDTLIAMVATVTMFSVIFSVPGMKDQLGASPVGMLFVSLPDLFYNEVPLGRLLAPMFYVLVAFAALTSTISMLEVVVANFMDQRGFSRKVATSICGGAILALSLLCSLSLGASNVLSNFTFLRDDKAGLLSNLDYLASNWMLPIGGLLITLAVGWRIPQALTEADLIDDNTPSWFSYSVWRFTMRFVVPIAVGAIIFAVIRGNDFS